MYSPSMCSHRSPEEDMVKDFMADLVNTLHLHYQISRAAYTDDRGFVQNSRHTTINLMIRWAPMRGRAVVE